MNSNELGGAIAGGVVAYVVISIIAIALCVLLIIAQWKIFTKAGEKGWKSIIPIYNLYILTRLADGKGIKFLLLLIPIVGYIIINIKLAKAFGKGGGFTAGLILLPSIFTLILGFGSAQYIGPNGVAQQQ